MKIDKKRKERCSAKYQLDLNSENSLKLSTIAKSNSDSGLFMNEVTKNLFENEKFAEICQGMKKL